LNTVITVIYLCLAFSVDWRVWLVCILYDIARAFEDIANEKEYKVWKRITVTLTGT
jgi:hypothetical protein